MDIVLGVLKILLLIPLILIALSLVGAGLFQLTRLIGWVRGRIRRHALIAQFRRQHSAHGKTVLIAFSDSPEWAPYIEANILPRIHNLCVVLKWPKRKRRPYADLLEYQLTRGYNPIAIVVPLKGKTLTVNFHDAFMRHKRGITEDLHRCEEELYRMVGLSSDTSPSMSGSERRVD